MSNPGRRRTIVALVILVLLLLLLLVILGRCTTVLSSVLPKTAPASSPVSASSATPTSPPEEKLTPATLKAPEQMGAGAVFTVEWTGPNNAGDYVALAVKDASVDKYSDTKVVQTGNPLSLTASVEPGDYELRYITSRSRTILGRAAIQILPATATLKAADEAIQGTALSIEWTGPNNAGDYVTVVAQGTEDGKYGNYTVTSSGSPLTLTLPVTTGAHELRYMTGQGGKVSGRRPLTITGAAVTLSGPTESVAGSEFKVEWTGPNNAGDYITVVAKDTADGQYGNYTNTSASSPLTLTAPMDPGAFEIRYMTGQGAKVLARTPITIVAAVITLEAPAEATAKSLVTVQWTGPNNKGDYITIVPQDLPDGQYKAYANTSGGASLSIAAPETSGPAEIRYMSGQGGKVLKRQPILIR